MAQATSHGREIKPARDGATDLRLASVMLLMQPSNKMSSQLSLYSSNMKA